MNTSVKTSATTHHPAGPVDVDELKRAWHAVQAGEFRTPQRRARGDRRDDTRPMDTWTPEPWEEALVVLGCAGSSGATTVALAMGLSAMAPVRVVECGSVTTSGLAAASTAELGLHPEEAGYRGAAITSGSNAPARSCPVPTASRTRSRPNCRPRVRQQPRRRRRSCLTILDAGWEAGQLLRSDSWIA